MIGRASALNLPPNLTPALVRLVLPLQTGLKPQGYLHSHCCHVVMLKPEHQPLQLLQSGQLLSLADLPHTGLILQKAFHCEFIGPGAAVGGMFDLGCRSIYPLGAVQFTVPTTPAERRQAFQLRVFYLERLQSLAIAESPLRRAKSLLDYLEAIVGSQITAQIPEELLAKLVGVLPATLTLAKGNQPPNLCTPEVAPPRPQNAAAPLWSRLAAKHAAPDLK